MVCNYFFFFFFNTNIFSISSVVHCLTFYIDNIFFLRYEQCLYVLLFAFQQSLNFLIFILDVFSVLFLIILKAPITTGIAIVFICFDFKVFIFRNLFKFCYWGIFVFRDFHNHQFTSFFSLIFNSYVWFVCFDFSVCLASVGHPDIRWLMVSLSWVHIQHLGSAPYFITLAW